MKIKRLGIEWGAAFAEAQPIRITSEDGTWIEIYEREGFGLTIETQERIRIEPGLDRRALTIVVNP